MALLELVIDLIDMRSFTSVWFWIVVAVYWSLISQSVLGAPYDLLLQAARAEPEAEGDLNKLVAIHARRKLAFTRRAGHWVVGVGATILTLIVILASSYRLEFAQALLFLAVPMTLVRGLELRLCFRLERENPHSTGLARILLRHRFQVQLLGLIAIFVTAVWGMIHALSRSMLGF